MPITFDPVQPGDIISSELMNQLFDKVEELEQRLLNVEEGSGSVVVTSFTPQNEVAVGATLEIAGLNFAFPPNDNTVVIHGTRVVTFLGGSTSGLLRLVVPPAISIAAGGENVTISIVNTLGSTQVTYRLLPAIPVVGDSPTIISINNLDGSVGAVAFGEFFLINGTNFATTALENRITFTLTTIGGPVTLPADGDTLEIESGSPASEQLRVRMPDFAEIIEVGIPVPMALELQVGAHPVVTPPDAFFVVRQPLP